MNIKDIAALAGVSSATVSRYLNHGYVSAANREKLRAIIEEHQYQPSSMAQTLRTKKTMKIGVILPRIDSATISRIVEGISLSLRGLGYHLLLANTYNDTAEELRYLRLFRENQVDGIIFIATLWSRKHQQLVKACKVPVVLLGQQNPTFSCIYHADGRAAYEATKAIVNAARKIGYIGVTQSDQAVGQERRTGFYRAIQEEQQVRVGLADADAALTATDIEVGFSMEDGYKGAKQLLSQNPQLDSLVCATDTIAIGAMRYLKEVGVSIPVQIQVIGLGDSPVGDLLSPRLSTVHFSYKTSGIEAGKLLLEAMQDEQGISGGGPHKAICLDTSLLLKESTRQGMVERTKYD
ncbi:MAG: LacI family DNA-binding transcriptional regulator [Eubacteriales bacterium]|nr:LacI family DNA-binding transcriptional regulator [Eubacteriales bacterium]